jgi:dihydrofolate synthase/folylpolyglutamate synthase
LPGAHQRQNAALALLMARHLRPALADYDAAAALARTRWPGRLEVIETDPLMVIDVGHTPGAIAAARAGFDAMREGRPAALVCGASIDKDAAAIIAALAPGFATLICASARHKGRPAAEIAALARDAAPEAEIVLAEDIPEARRLALAWAAPPGGAGRAIYVAGGLFLAAEFKAAHIGRDPALLAFF